MIEGLSENGDESGNSAQLGDSSGMASAVELGRQKRRETILRRLDADNPAAEGEDVRVVMLPREPCRQAVVAQRRA
jgi:hypothetical protein